jgi:hypothetical protein
MKRLIGVMLTAAILFAAPPPTLAKTTESAKAENIFFYADDAQGKPVLIKVIPLAELDKIAHGQAIGGNYCYSATDNYPTTQYTEARGVTLPEFAAYVSEQSSVSLKFGKGDTMRFMATDSYGSYNRAWGYDALYGEGRYYFEGLFDAWKPAWEIAGAEGAKSGVSLAEYEGKYKTN